MGLIRTFVTLDERMFKTLFTAMVRPLLEYANQIWHPHKIRDIEAVENVPRRATRMLPTMKALTYEERLRKLDLPTLAFRKSTRGDMIEVFKIVKEVPWHACSSNPPLAI